MTDYNKLFSNLRNKMKNVDDPSVYQSLKSDVNNYFSQINIDYNFKSKDKTDFLNWIESMEDKNRKMHIFYYNGIDNIKKLASYYLNLKDHTDANNVMKNFVNSKVSEIKSKNTSNKNNDQINKRMSKYYNESIETVNYYTNIIKYIFYTLLTVTFVLFLVKKQYKNRRLHL